MHVYLPSPVDAGALAFCGALLPLSRTFLIGRGLQVRAHPREVYGATQTRVRTIPGHKTHPPFTAPSTPLGGSTAMITRSVPKMTPGKASVRPAHCAPMRTSTMNVIAIINLLSGLKLKLWMDHFFRVRQEARVSTVQSLMNNSTMSILRR